MNTFLKFKYSTESIGCGEEDWIAYSAEYMESGEEIGLMVSADKIAVSANEAN